MLNLHTLPDDLNRVLGDHAEIECEIDNVQCYLDAVAARHKVAPDIEECAWLMLFSLYRSGGQSRGEMTAAQVCEAVPCSPTGAVNHITALLKGGYARFDQSGGHSPQPPLRITDKGKKVVSAWLSLMHLGARRPISIATTSIVSAIEAIARRDIRSVVAD